MTQETITSDDEPTRRDFIHIFAGATTAVGVGALLWPLVDQMNPDASVLALSTVEVDLSAIERGQAIKVMWQGKPVFIRHRTEAEIEEATATSVGALKDKASANENCPDLDAADNNRVMDADGVARPDWLIVVGVCTHLGCIPARHHSRRKQRRI